MSLNEKKVLAPSQGKQLIKEAKQPLCLRAYVVSDIHLNSQSYDEELNGGANPQGRHFQQFLAQVRDEHHDKTDSLQLILNGDILDITGSWYSDTLPWDLDIETVEKTLLAVLDKILNNNQSIVNELKALTSLNNVQIHYIVGNHDGLLNLFPSAKNMLKERLAPDEKSQNQILFSNSLESVELGLYVEHGHELDSFNRPDKHNIFTHYKFSFGDYVNILLINRFVHKVALRLRELNYTEEKIKKVRRQLHDIEYLRPLTLIPLWVQTVARQYQDDPEHKGKEAEHAIDSVILTEIAEILNSNATRPLLEKLNLPSKLFTSFLNWLVHLPGSLSVVTLLISFIYRRHHSNKPQLKRAQELHKKKSYRFVAFGHTHGPTMKLLSQDGYYFNTGSWKPVINLFKTLDFDEGNLEALNPFVRFNKIEHSAILKIEKKMLLPDSEVVFSLQTTRGSELF